MKNRQFIENQNIERFYIVDTYADNCMHRLVTKIAYQQQHFVTKKEIKIIQK
jgi:predicted DNA-binding WGR domain protein